MPGYLDITGAKVVEVDIRADRKVVWLNVDGITIARVCRIGELHITDRAADSTRTEHIEEA